MGKWGRTVGSWFGFRSIGEYVGTGFVNEGPLTLPKLVGHRVLKTKTFEEMKQDSKAETDVELPRTLNKWTLITTGVGFMVGAGIFVSPGYIAVSFTGPALFLAYAVAAISALLSAMCYAEFTVTMPLAGAAYNYVYSTLGEFIAWVTVSNLILQYILANAAGARGFAPYLGILCNQTTSFFLIDWNGYTIDPFAGGLTIACVLLLVWGIKESANTNAIVTMIHVSFMIFIIIAGLTQASASNMQPFFLPGGSWKDIFNGAAVAFFSFLGFDAVATTAEEVINPTKDMPVGILGSVSIVTLLYMMMTLTLTLMVPTSEISEDAAFAAAFESVGLDWAKYIIAIAALMGIFTTTLIGVLGGARILVGAARERMMPPVFATVGSWRQTPWLATWAIGLPSAGIAVFSDFASLADMISIGTFLVFLIVAIALLWLRGHVKGVSTTRNIVMLTFWTFAFIGLALGFTLVWTLPAYQAEVPGYTDDEGMEVPAIPAGKWAGDQGWWLLGIGCAYLLAMLGWLFTVKQDFISEKYALPLFPLVPGLTIFINIFLMGQLSVKAFEDFGWWTVASVSIYLLYGMIAQQAAENRTAIDSSRSGALSDGGLASPASAKPDKDVYLADMAGHTPASPDPSL